MMERQRYLTICSLCSLFIHYSLTVRLLFAQVAEAEAAEAEIKAQVEECENRIKAAKLEVHTIHSLSAHYLLGSGWFKPTHGCGCVMTD